MKHSPRKLRSKRKYHGKANKTTPTKQTFGSDRRQANKSEIKQIKTKQFDGDDRKFEKRGRKSYQ